jgi:hypothetical protein
MENRGQKGLTNQAKIHVGVLEVRPIVKLRDFCPL